MGKLLLFLFIGFLLFTTNCSSMNLEPKDDFQHPAQQTKPRTWWRWLNGNISKECITKDLEAIKAKGMNGVTLFNLGAYYPKGEVRFLSDEWLEMFDFSVDECERLGLDFSFQMCDGWSTSGGPWVTKEHAMKVVTSSKINVKGGTNVEMELPQPYTNLDFYKDIKVLAFPAIDTSTHYFNAKNVKVKFGGRVTEPEKLIDGSQYTFSNFGFANDEEHVIDFEMDKPYVFSAVNVYQGPRETPVGPQKCEVLFSNNGKDYQGLTTFNVGDIKGGAEFAPTKAKYFRLKILEWTSNSRNGSWAFLSEVEFLSPDNISTFPKINDFERKASVWHRRREIEETKDIPSNLTIKKNKVLDLTANYKNGKLNWQVPEGAWTIVRIGYTLNGMKNGPATEEGKGLECDKLSKEAVDVFYDGYAGKMLKRSKEHTGKTITRLFADSFEAMPQNWTPGFGEEFEKRTGYPIDEFLLVLSGEIVGSVDESEGFLHDFRKTLSEMLAENYYGHLNELCHTDNVKFVAQIAGEQQMVANPILYAGKVDVPGIEFWIKGKPEAPVLFTNGSAIFDAVSASRIYNRPIIPSEAFTYKARDFNVTPAMMKPIADKAFTYGMNQFEMHTYIHQPDDKKPGWQHYMAGFAWGRNITWWDMAAGELTNYFSRVQSVLQKGQAVSDILVYTGEELPNSLEFSYKIHDPDKLIPRGYKFDVVNSSVLQNMVEVKQSLFTLTNGLQYKVLVLPPTDKMSLSVLQKIEQFVKAGGIVVGPKPTRGYGIKEDDKKIAELADKLWKSSNEHPGKVYGGISLAEVLKKENITPDFDYASNEETDFQFIHKVIDNKDVYFISNQNKISVNLNAKFRQSGKIPEILLPKDGSIYKQQIYLNENNQISMPLSFDPNESKFVVFSSGKEPHVAQIKKEEDQIYPFNGKSYYLPLHSEGESFSFSEKGKYSVVYSNGRNKEYVVNEIPEVYEIKPPFNVSFDEKWGGPRSIVFDDLVSWTKHPLPGIKYYSGTAVYRKEFKLEKKQLGENLKMILQFDKIRETAEIYINGQSAGVIWSANFSCDISKLLKEGENILEIHVANTWNNRIAGDDLSASKERYTYFPVKGYSPQSKRKPFKEGDILESGIMGKIRIKFLKKIDIYKL